MANEKTAHPHFVMVRLGHRLTGLVHFDLLELMCGFEHSSDEGLFVEPSSE